MPGFDAEYYLRCAAEDALRTGDVVGVSDRARALAAVQALTWDDAMAVLDQYEQARVLRGDYREFYVDRSGAAPPVPRRVCGCARLIEQPWGTVRLRYVSFTDHDTEIAAEVDMKPDADLVAGASAVGWPGGRHTRFFHHGPPELRVSDNRRRAQDATFNGDGSDKQWRGGWTAEPGLSTDATWIELLGTRIELVDVTTPFEVQVENLDLEPATVGVRARRHLEHLLEAISLRHSDGDRISAAIDTLAACGALTAESPTFARTRAVAEALETGQAGPIGHVSPRWSSVLHPPRRSGGPDRSMVLGLTTPMFDGQSLTIMALEVRDGVLRVDYQGVGALAEHFDRPRLDAVVLTFSAADDRGNHYLGRLGSHGQRGPHIEGTVQFTPVLDPDATELDLVLTTDRARVTIHLPLQWAERP